MQRDPRYDILFEPVRIGPVTAKNRFFQVPHCNGMGYAMPEAHAAMRAAKAEGGWAVISTEECEIHPTGDISPYVEARLWDDSDIPALALLCEAFTEDASRPSPELLRLHPRLAPIKAAVFPLVNKDGMPEISARLHGELARRFRRLGFIEHDVRASIGKRYARMDEAGCPFCFTIDGQTVQDQTVTVRDRDSGQQERIALDQVTAYLADRLGA